MHLLTRWQEAPLIAFVMVAPHAQRQGLAEQTRRCSIAVLWEQGETTFTLFVTGGHTPAQRLYANHDAVISSWMYCHVSAQKITVTRPSPKGRGLLAASRRPKAGREAESQQHWRVSALSRRRAADA